MLPPVDPNILAKHPSFDVLYRDLCTNKLNEDGTTRIDAKQQKERDAFNEELRKARVLATKKNLIKTYLPTLASRHSEFPDELRELITVVTAVINSNVTDEEAYLLNDDYQKLKSNIVPLSRALSKSIASDLAVLARIAGQEEDAAAGGNLLQHIENMKREVITARAQTAANRLDIVKEATDVHALYCKVLETCVRLLEQTIHGSVSRGAKAKADYLATVAEGMSKKLQLQHNQLLSLAYAPEMQEALQARIAQLDQESLVLKRRTREAEERLAEYTHSKALAEMAKEYAEIMRETQKVQEDIARLESQRS